MTRTPFSKVPNKFDMKYLKMKYPVGGIFLVRRADDKQSTLTNRLVCLSSFHDAIINTPAAVKQMQNAIFYRITKSAQHNRI